MKWVLRFLAVLAAVGTAFSLAIYFLQKRGVLRIEVNYDDKDGVPVTRQLDEIVETAASSVGEKVKGTANEVKSKIENTIDTVNEKVSSISFKPKKPAEDISSES